MKEDLDKEDTKNLVALKSPKVSSKIISVKLNNPKVTRQTIRNYFKQMEIIKIVPEIIPIITKDSITKVLDWPANSPDLNLIENL